MFFSGRR